MRRLRAPLLVAVFVLLLVPAVAWAAFSSHISLQLNGVAVQGESTIPTLGRADTIQCLESTFGMARVGTQTVPEPVVCVKRIDKSTPLLYQGLAQNQVAEFTLRGYRLSPAGDGTTQQHFTVEVVGRIERIEGHAPEQTSPTDRPMVETVTFIPTQSFLVRYEDGGAEYLWEAPR